MFPWQAARQASPASIGNSVALMSAMTSDHADNNGAQQRFGPPLGGRRPDEVGPDLGRLLADPQVGRRWGMAGGCAFDAEGNLWVTIILANRIVAISPDGTAMVVLDDPDGALLSGPTSIAWGGQDMRDVYIGSILTPYVLKGRSSVPGLPMVHQRQWR
ncbi:SMP-30/gluconolactonase/LRE family protein [Mycobacterium sp.]|uniref:SMP-30/gluconolactonase/LRE family protein n=1 Tax=Mycobacterium sp. TaxID=1785 RepID=UPI003F977CF9